MSLSYPVNLLQPPAWMNTLRRFWTPPRPSRDMTTKRIQAIREQSKLYRKLTDVELCALADQPHDQTDFDAVAITALAAGLEATWRVLKIDLYDCQLQGALELVRGSIVQLQTGEGKTFVAMLAAVCFAFSGRSPHVMTVNSYLARRDCEQLSAVYRALGLTVGLTDSGMSIEEKQRGYRSSIVYGPGYEFGFDYLRDQLAILSQPPPKLGERVLDRWRKRSTFPAVRREPNAADFHDFFVAERRKPSGSSEFSRTSPNGSRRSATNSIQTGLSVAIVDEADSVMLDEASTPLILTAGQKVLAKNANVYRFAHTVAQQLRRGTDYQLSQQDGGIQWTDVGLVTIGEPPAMIRSGLERAWQLYLQQAIFAAHCLRRDVHYLIDEGSIQLIDQHTGRILADRSWAAGLQQAVEAKEELAITSESQALATITRQRFLCLYPTMCGLTGTATGSELEIREVYRLNVSEVAPNRPSQMRMFEPQMLLEKRLHEEAIVASVKACRQRQQPVLIGTTSVQSSERLAVVLTAVGIEHQLLTGRQDADEADIIAEAGKAGAVTIATNIAGRGTDIRLGAGVAELGGLHVISTELHESQRVERQLMGRAARQGDPGSFELILSTEDSLLLRFAPELVRRLRNDIVGRRLENSDWIRELRTIQKQLEVQRSVERRRLFARDDWQEAMARDFA